jgi:hypothetical protein
MLVDARWPPPEPEPDRSPLNWARLRWPILTLVLLTAAHVVPALVAYVFLIAALYCAVESFALLLPDGDGLRKHQQ